MKPVWVEILKFPKYNNPRKGIKSTSWYRMQNDFIEHPDFFDLENSQRLLWPYLLGNASKKICPSIQVSLGHAAAMVKATPELVRETLQYFQEKGLIEIVSADVAEQINEAWAHRHEAPRDAREPDGDEDGDADETDATRAGDVRETDARRMRDADDADESRMRDESVQNAEHNGTERNDNGTTYRNTPLTPPPKGGRPPGTRERRTWAKDLATALATKAVGTVRNSLQETEARSHLGGVGWALLLSKFGSWDGFRIAYAAATTVKRGGGTNAQTFEAQLRESFRALLLEAPPGWTGEEAEP